MSPRNADNTFAISIPSNTLTLLHDNHIVYPHFDDAYLVVTQIFTVIQRFLFNLYRVPYTLRSPSLLREHKTGFGATWNDVSVWRMRDAKIEKFDIFIEYANVVVSTPVS
jgi:hypothetical protein